MRFFFSFVSLLFAFTSASAQGFHWEPTHGPSTDAAWMLLVNGNGDLIASSLNAIVRSTDEGRHWVPFPNSNFVGETPAAATLPDGHIFIGNTRLNFDGYGRKTLSNGTVSFFYSDRNGNVYSVGTSSIARSSDDGNAWQTIHGPASETMNCIAVDAGHYYVGTNTGVYSSSDSGATWKRSLNGLPNSSYLGIQTGSAGRVWAASWAENGSSTFVSYDFGETWSPIASPGFRSAHLITARKDNTALLYYGDECGGGLGYLSDSNLTNVGSFLQSKDGSLGGYNVAALDSNGNWVATSGEECNGPDDMSGAASNIYFTSNDSANTWKPIPAPLSTITALFPAYNTVIGLHQLGSFIMDDSENWRHSSTNSVTISESDPYDNSLLGSSANGGLQRSTDSGVTWTNIFPSAPAGLIYAAATSARTIYAGSNGVFVTTNSGSTWNETNDATLGTITGLLVSTTGTIYASSSNGLFVSNNSGNSWSSIGPSGTSPLNFLRTNAAGTLALSSSGVVFRSNDQGTTWQSASIPNGTGLVINNNGDVFTSSATGVYYWPNHSTLTYKVSDSLQGRHVTALAMSAGGSIYAAVPGLGVWKGVGDLSTLSVAEQPSAITLTASPNPASSNVNITLPSEGNWTAIASDALGRACAMSYDLSGETLQCDLSKLAPGTYEIILRSGEKHFVSRVQVIR